MVHVTGLRSELARDLPVYSSSDLMTGMNPVEDDRRRRKRRY
jgi:hypothetical protein